MAPSQGGPMLAPATFALLSLLAVEPRLALDLRLSPPLALASRHEQAPPDLAPPLLPGAAAPRSIGGATVRAALGLVLTDLAAAGLMVIGFSQMCLFESCSGDSGGALFLAGVGTWVFVSPAVAVRFARGGGGGSFGKAYWLAWLLRLGAAAALTLEEPGLAVLAATELVLAPFVIAKVLDATADDWRDPELEPVAALAYVTPERDPAGPRGR